MLTTIDIERALRIKRGFVGVFPISDLPINLLQKPCSLVINLDERWKIGSHWVSLFIPKRGPAFYFDSFGRPPPDKILTLIERNTRDGWTYNNNKIQGDLSTLCGHYCIAFVESLPNYKEFLRKFENCSVFNDERLIKFLVRN